MQEYSDDSHRLFKALAEQLKLSLVQIIRQNQVSEMPDLIVTTTASMGLKFIDGFLLSSENFDQKSLLFEPVSIGSVIYQAASDVAPYAEMYGCKLRIDMPKKLQPVMTSRESLRLALSSMVSAFAEANQAHDSEIVITAYKSSEGIVTGVYSEQMDISAEDLMRALSLKGSSRQPLSQVSASPSVGVFIANAILTKIAAPITASKHNHLKGLSTILLPSRQLKLM